MLAKTSLIMKPASLAILTGIMIGTSYIPFPPWAIFFCFVPLWIAWLENPTYKQVFVSGWIAQFILTMIGFNWVAHTVHEFGHLNWVVSALVLMLFCAFANLYIPVAGLLWLFCARTFKLNAIGRRWSIPIFVAALERTMPTIFDWHFGYTWLWSRLPGLQLADLIGFIGLSTIGIVANTFIVEGWYRRAWSWVVITPLIFLSLNLAGYLHGQGAGEADKKLRVLLVQANIGNQEKLESEQGSNYRNNVLNQFTAETLRGLATEGPADFAIWPETAFPDMILDPHLSFGYPLRLKQFILQSGTGLITGGYARDLKGKLTNSFFVMNAQGEWLAPPYHKTMLLAFGEYFPGGEMFPRLYSMIPEVGNLGRGPGPTVMHLPDLTLGPQICYEGLFDWFARSLANQGAQLIVNITNDSWYGTWEEPFQHGFMTLAKAVEVRRPVIRSTNTGISAVALANGDILALSPLHKVWFHLYEVPYASNPQRTFFMGFGFWLIPLLLFFGLLTILVKDTRNEMTNLDWDEILNRLAEFATSQTGRERLRLTAPLTSKSEAEQSFREIADALEILALGRRPFMESLDLYSIWQGRLRKSATLKTLELKDVRHFCLEILALSEILKDHRTPWAEVMKKALMDATEPLSAIDQIMTPEGDIRSDASELLFKLFNEKNTVVRQTQNILDKLIRQHEMEPVLQDRYVTNREGRWVLPIRSGKQGSFEGIIHASSQSKQTVFMEPKEIIPLNNRLRQVEVDIEDEIDRLLTDLSNYLVDRIDDFELAAQVLADGDVRFAQAQLASRMDANAPIFDDEQFQIQELKHPLLIFAGIEVIPNTVQLNKDRRILLLSGPNAGGKTVLLKSVGLAAQMARCGLLIAAAVGSRLPFIRELLVAVGDAQSVDLNLSTFAAHLKVLDAATHAHGPSSLLLIDEICGSTDPDEGTALARAFIKAFSANGSFGVITSHLGPLKTGWASDSGVVNGSLEYDSRSGRPSYQFLMGIAGQSLALQTARRVGVNPKILDDAMEFLDPETKKYHLGLAEIEQMKDELRDMRDQTLKESRDAKTEKSRYAALVQEFERERERKLDAALNKAEKKIDTLIEHSKVEDVFRRHERLEQIKNEMPEIVKSAPRTTPVIRIESAEDFARVFPPGSKVFAASIGRDGVVQSAPNTKGEVAVLSKSMRLMVPWSQLKAPQTASNPTIEVVRRAGETASLLDQDRQVDLRGNTLEAALHTLELQLDTAVINEEGRVKIIHGHGTEALKKGVRNYLSRSPYVKKWKAGTPETGGDGVTWVELKD